MTRMICRRPAVVDSTCVLGRVRVILYAALFLGALFSGAKLQAAAMSAASSQEEFRKANELYRQQKFPEAHDRYKQIVDAGVRSPELYYNLANTSSRLGNKGEAVLWYERARQMAPRDADISANLQRVAPPGNNAAGPMLLRPFVWLLDFLSVREWNVVFFSLAIAASFLAALVLSRRFGPGGARFLRRLGWTVGALALLVAPFAATKFVQAQSVQVIVMKGETIARSGPGDSYSAIASLQEGAKLRRLDFSDPAWVQVALPDGQHGFAPSANLQTL